MAIRLVAISADGRLSQKVSMDEMVSSVCEATTQMYGRVGYVLPWVGYLAILDGDAVGACSFKAPPKDGHVEIAYFTFPGFEGRGIATAMAKQLIEVARATDRDLVVLAQTLPEMNASTRILHKLGFTHRGTVVHPEDGQVWEWILAPVDDKASP